MNDTTRTAAPAESLTRTADPHAHLGKLANTVDTPPGGGEAARATVTSPDGYDVQELIGAGGMGEVFRAHHRSLDRDVAVKVLHPKYAADSRAADMFYREAKITARLQHPGIPPVHAMGRLPDGRPYLVMKVIEGETLARILDRDGPGAAKWLGVFEQVCQAVGYAHSRGVIHRDLKPANVMVGAFGEVQVMDWGLARESNRPDPESAGGLPTDEADTATITGTVKGTPAFMAPEQARGDVRVVTERSDVFSLGAVLCALLTGKPPYPGTTSQEVVTAAAAGNVADALKRLDGCACGRDVIALAKRCLSSNPADRPADARAVAAEVARIHRAAEQAVHTWRVRRWQLALGGVVLAVLVVAGVVAWGNARVEEERVRAVLRTRDELARKLDEVEYHLAAGDLNEGFDGYAEAKGLAALDPDPESSLKKRLERVRRNSRTAFDLVEFKSLYSLPAPYAPSWEAFDKAFTRVGITLDFDRPGLTAEQIGRHPFANEFRKALERQSERDTDRTRASKLALIAAVVKVERGTQFAATSTPNMFGD